MVWALAITWTRCDPTHGVSRFYPLTVVACLGVRAFIFARDSSVQLLANGDSHVRFWSEAQTGGGKSAEEWKQFLQPYNSGVDGPLSLFHPTLMDVYPAAKFILTTRSPDSWFDSYAFVDS